MKRLSNYSNITCRTTLILLLIAAPIYAQEYTVGVPVCDTISTFNVYSHNAFCADQIDTLKIMLHSNLIPYVTGLRLQLQIVAVNGRISSNVSDPVKAGDIFPLPASNTSGIYKFATTLNSSFQYTAKIIGTPMIANEIYY